MTDHLLRYLDRFEKVIVIFLIGFMVVTAALATLELGFVLIRDVASHPRFLLGIEELLDVFGMFLLVLLALELLETIKAYLIEHAIHVEVVMVVALIAIARKVIILDIKETDAMTLISIGFVVLTLSIGYYLISRVFHRRVPLADAHRGKKEAAETTAL